MAEQFGFGFQLEHFQCLRIVLFDEIFVNTVVDGIIHTYLIITHHTEIGFIEVFGHLVIIVWFG